MLENLFEVVMLLCFGFAWPFSIYRSYRSKSNRGMSLAFLIIVIAGYAAGILNNYLNGMNYVIFFYAANTVMVLVNTLIFVNNMKYDNIGKGTA